MSATHSASVLRDPALSWTGTTSSLFGIFFKNLLLTVVTLGLYRFWAITNMRQYVWSNIRVAGQPLEYTGTGGELFRGFLLSLLLMLLIVAVSMGIGFAIGGDLKLDGAPAGLIIGVYLLFLPMIFLGYAFVFLSRRYLMTRTQLRGIRFGQDGSVIGFVGSMFGRMLLCAITLGIHTPWMTAERLRRTVGATRWGNLKFDFKGKGVELFGWYVLTFLIVMAIMAVIAVLVIAPMFANIAGISRTGKISHPGDLFSVWQIVLLIAGYIAVIVVPGLILISAIWRFTISNMTLDNDTLRFELKASLGQLMLLVAANLGIVILSLGLLAPIAIQRVMTFFTSHIALTGAIDLTRVSQPPEETGRLSNIIAAGASV